MKVENILRNIGNDHMVSIGTGFGEHKNVRCSGRWADLKEVVSEEILKAELVEAYYDGRSFNLTIRE